MSRPRAVAFLVPALLVVSGAAALVHETAWFRLLIPVVGAGAIPSAVVAAGALLGIGLGAALGGRRADTARSPARVLAAAEIAGAALGVLVPFAVRPLEGLPLLASLPLATLVLTLAALPWGASIPAAVALLAPPRERIGSAFARLYAWNTLGAVLGILASVLFLFEAFGNRAVVALAAAAQGLVAFGALALGAGRAPASSVRPTRALDPPAPDVPGSGRVLAFAAALAGAAGVATQVAWTRRLVPVLVATFPVFGIVLAVHLLGIVAGAALLGPRAGRRPSRAIGLLGLAAALVTAASPLFLGVVVGAFEPAWWAHHGDPSAMFGLRAAIAGLLVLPSVALGAALLPWFVRVRARGTDEAGQAAGWITAANTVGGAAGGLLAALVAIPAIGTAGTLLVAAGALGLAAACATRGPLRLATGCLGALLVLVPVVAPFEDRVGHVTIGALYDPTAYQPEDALTLLATEGRTASVLVRDRDGRLEFWVEGSFEASTGPTDRLHLGLLGHLPLALVGARTDRAPRVALVGLGAGLTAQAAAAYAPASLDVYELEPEVVRASERFRAAGGGVPASATVRIADGRRGIAEAREGFDVISSDPVHPAIAGSAFLYSLDWWKDAIARLTPEGVLVQWMPLYQVDPDDLRLVLRTFSAAVPHPYVFTAGPDALLVGARTPLRLSEARLAAALARPAAAPLREQGFGTPGRLLALLAAGPEGVRAAGGAGGVNTDDHLLLETRCGRREVGDPDAAYGVLRDADVAPEALLDAAPTESFVADVRRAARQEAALAAWTRWDLEAARNRFAELATAEPWNVLARRMRDEATIERAFEWTYAGRSDRAVPLAREVAARTEDVDPILRLDAADLLLRAGHADEARAIAAPYAATRPWPRARRLAEAGR